MRHRAHKIFQALAVIAFSVAALVAQTKVSIPSQELEGQAGRVNLDQVTLVNAASGALKAVGAPGGIVTTSACGPETTFNLTPAGSRLRDILNSIVTADPRYHLTVDHEVLNLTQMQRRPTLLDVVIPKFDIEGEATVDTILERLLGTPALQKAVVEFNLERGHEEIGLRSLERPGYAKTPGTAFDIHLSDVSLRTALNAIARAHGTAVWHYASRHCKGTREFTLKFLVW